MAWGFGGSRRISSRSRRRSALGSTPLASEGDEVYQNPERDIEAGCRRIWSNIAPVSAGKTGKNQEIDMRSAIAGAAIIVTIVRRRLPRSGRSIWLLTYRATPRAASG